MQTIQLRPYRSKDLEPLVAMWHISKRQAFPYVEAQQHYTLEDDRDYFQRVVLPGSNVWVVHAEHGLLGFMALQSDLIDLLFVAVQAQGQGGGTALVNKAKVLWPCGLRACTFQRNKSARSFFRKHAFAEVGFGVSPPPEDEPDVELAWVPGMDCC